MPFHNIIELGDSLPPVDVEAPSINRFQQGLRRGGQLDWAVLQSPEVWLQAPAQSPSSLPVAGDEMLRRWRWDGSSPPCSCHSFPPIHPWLLSGMSCQAAALMNELPGWPRSSAPALGTTLGFVLQYRAGQAVWSLGTADHTQNQRAWLHPRPRDKTVPHGSPFLSTEVCNDRILLEGTQANQSIQPRAGFAVP